MFFFLCGVAVYDERIVNPEPMRLTKYEYPTMTDKITIDRPSSGNLELQNSRFLQVLQGDLHRIAVPNYISLSLIGDMGLNTLP